MELNGKVAVVTGSSRGIGLAIARALLLRGVKVAGWSRTNPNISTPGFRFIETNVADFHSVSESLNRTVSELGDVSILINNAGLGFEAELENLTLEQWHEMFDVNVNGMFYCTKLLLPLMKKNGSGHIINISSVAGTTGIPGMVGYCSTKFAVRGFSNALFKEVRKHGVKVTCVYPGSVDTNFFDKIESVNANPDMLRPEDVAATVVHCLESPDNYLPVDIEVRPMKGKG